MQLLLATQQPYNTLLCDIYRDENRNPYMTIEQLANGLGYKSKNGLEKLMDRNPRLREKRFSITATIGYESAEVRHHETGERTALENDVKTYKRETRLFNEDGIMEVCFLSRTKNAEIFRDWARDIIKAFNKGQIAWIVKREIEKPIRRDLTDAIKNWTHYKPHSYINITNLLCKTITGFTASNLKKQRQQDTKRPLYDVLTSDELERYIKLENQVISLIELQQDYTQIKTLIQNQKYTNTSKILATEKGMSPHGTKQEQAN